MPTLQPIALEPRQTAVLLVILVHAAVIAAAVWWAGAGDSARHELFFPTPTPATSDQLTWRHPSVFRAIDKSPPPANALPPAATTPSPAATLITPEANSQSARFITLSRRNIQPMVQRQTESVAPSANSPATLSRPAILPDKNLYAELDRIDEAIHQAFMQVWQPPEGKDLSPSKRAARLDLSFSPAMEIEEADLVTPSGSPEFDLSILEAVDRVRQMLPTLKAGGHSIKIPKSLPSTFQNLRYDCRIQFQIE